MASKAQLDLDYSKLSTGFCNGMVMPQCYETVEEHLPKVKAMEIRDDDIMLCSFPKSGTHWMYRVIDMLQRGQAVYDKRCVESTFLDLQRIELISELDSPRLLSSHVPFDLLPEQVKAKRTKMVHVYRNPRAVLVSVYFQTNNAKPVSGMIGEDISLDKKAAIFFSNEMAYGGWFSYMDKVKAFQQENPDQPLLNISYEEMSLNPFDTVKRLAEFLEKPATPEFCAEVVEACSFKKQKESEEALYESQAALKYYRKGDMNDWKNYVTVAMNEKFDEVLKDRADKCSFSAKYAKL